MKTSPLFWDQLLQLIGEERVVPIVGRELLVVEHNGVEVPFARLLAERLAEYLSVDSDELPEGAELNEVTCRHMAARGDLEDVYPALKQIMPADGEIELPPALLQLAEIGSFNLFVSTTFDPLLQLAINKVRFGGESRVVVRAFSPARADDLPEDGARPGRPVVYHLFGRLSAVPEYAVTQEDTLEFVHALQSRPDGAELLFDAMRGSNLLMIGCSFSGFLARMFLRIARDRRLLNTSGRVDYMAEARATADDSLVMFLESFRAKTRVYREGDPRHFVAELHERWMQSPMAKQAQAHNVNALDQPAVDANPRDNTEGAVFLSYASEDRDAVARLRDALEAKGVPVFFDKEELRAGDEWDSKLRRSIERCALFLPVISRNALTGHRRYFRTEWEQAIEEARKAPSNIAFLVPVAIDSTSESEDALPARFRTSQWLRLENGEPTQDFVGEVVRLYREYHKATAAPV